MSYWPMLQRGPKGTVLAEDLLSMLDRPCHRCGAHGARKAICEGCELIVCDRCSAEGLCLECARAAVRGAA